jgi:hypothetical protein
MRAALSVVALALALAALATGCGGDSAGAPAPQIGSLRPFHDRLFSTAVPAAWRSRSLAKGGARIWFFGSGPKGADNLGFSSDGNIGLSITRLPAADLPTSPANARDGIRAIVGTPTGAADVVLAHAVADARLGGRPAATEGYTYRFRGRLRVQSNLAALYRGKLVLIEVDSEPATEATGARTLQAVTSHWRWNKSG